MGEGRGGGDEIHSPIGLLCTQQSEDSQGVCARASAGCVVADAVGGWCWVNRGAREREWVGRRGGGGESVVAGTVFGTMNLDGK